MTLSPDPTLLFDIDDKMRAFCRESPDYDANVSRWIHAAGDRYRVSLYLRWLKFDRHRQPLPAPILVLASLENLADNSGDLLPAQATEVEQGETSKVTGQAHGLGIFAAMRATSESLLAEGAIREIQCEHVSNAFLARSLARNNYRQIEGSEMTWSTNAAALKLPRA